VNNDKAFVNNFEQKESDSKPFQNKFFDEWDRELEAKSPKSSTSQTSQDSKSPKDSTLSKNGKTYRYLNAIKVN